ncbi:FMN-dependent oxidoreductase (nitrilotriacetate monooxygenase family) [Psychrobacillus insolitus]|uniref:FMN-dependent oxidoreductase (Nitrilotriacetate monooxygenase family) n=1 Tax=Psychrobacillus insolitus TaxID=1461 RepID=A0A2W7MPG0_9BACI|nr:LLM class flavin-dependent oxidoreductase [Psychrobacillus insolitus]PZX07034.1 FMN-dependent oxidoreductase (nitrilotriacetate monooxygenase family) [Psychrobacillus insolitus]
MTGKQMKLGAFFMLPGHHVAAWRHPEAQADQVLNFEFIKQQALTAERGKFDMLFLADGVAAGATSSSFEQHASAYFEPFTLLSGLATVTKNIGLVGTVSTTFNEPFNVARKFASLDHLSNGRAGWNVVTSSGKEAAQNFGQQDELLHEKRYERAHEFVDVVTKLWDSWEDDAIVYNKESGQYADATKVHAINHEGEWLSVAGPLNIARPVQGHPVVVQAGSSDAGKELAARTAEVVFTAWQTIEEAQAFYSDVKGRMAKYGRNPDELKIMPGVYPIIGQTEKEAQEKRQQLLDLIPESVGVSRLSQQLGIDLSGYPVDGPLPELPDVSQINGNKSRFQLVKDLADRDGLSIRQLYQHIAGARGHREIIGTPEQIADQLQEWFENGAADGFNVMPPVFPEGLNDFVDYVIPELQKRGIFREEYTGTTLREHLELQRPISQFAKKAIAVES